MTAALRVAALPVGPAGADPDAPWREVEAGAAAAARAGAALAVLPELTVLPCVAGDDPARWRHLAEPAAGPTVARMRALARRHRLALVFGMALAEDGAERPLNAALLAAPDGGVVRLAAKRRLPPPGPGDSVGEADHFRPGPAETRVVPVAGRRLAALVCYDRRFAESWDRLAGAADLVAVLVAGPAPQDPPGFFRRELAGHLRRCGLPAVAAARYGVEHGLGRPVRHDGESLVLGPDGTVLAASPPGAAAPALATLPPAPLRPSLPTA
ncbi:Nitrilase/cyanide hydratase and apolipoprotein N-acyltransferase [Methylobacterium sp. 4-46]|uniref:carbon-nitrogen hydrolase family protein n=1 Tax=unclassified Methylobacterium TaxID=2615210 RepID=UPI000152CEB0|nr:MULTISPECIES: carbon-nitrogen hydrolase family protein [Methylobacterium]ACA17883.1 Nitrilase/cyanide hydratase and apolipoprotein N-acyltransferase [Methylobacterium sp. 4-46]WFT77184.1 carbon-nitrogen hydrolase family protein [Methylobacterium nodulans]